MSNPGNSCLSAALNLLARSQMTSLAMRNKLMAKGFAAGEIETAMARLTEWKYLDDRSFAMVFIKSRREKYSRKKIRYELLKAGVDQQVAAELLGMYYPDEMEFAGCLALAQKICSAERDRWERKYRESAKQPMLRKEAFIYQKVKEKLLYKGYGLATVCSVLSRLFESENY
jgi:regulatory protein